MRFLGTISKKKKKFASYCEISTALNWLKHLIDYFRFFFPFFLSLRVHTNFEKSICHLLRSLVPIHSKGCLNCGNVETQSNTFEKSGNVTTYDYKHQFLKLERILRANDPFVDCCFKHLRYVKRGRIFVPCYDVIFVYPQKILVFHFATLVVFVPKIIDSWTTLFLPFEMRSWEFTSDRAVVFETRCLLPKYCKSQQLSLPRICKRLWLARRQINTTFCYNICQEPDHNLARIPCIPTLSLWANRKSVRMRELWTFLTNNRLIYLWLTCVATDL